MKLLARADQNPKTAKSVKFGYLTFPLHLAPAALSGNEVCPGRSAGCTLACLNTAGRGQFTATQIGRVRKTRLFFSDRKLFMAMLVADVKAAVRQAARLGLQCAIRLNATSDIPWHRVPVQGFANIMAMFPDVQFYDYTKVFKRLFEALPANYHLTFSLSETNAEQAAQALASGKVVAAVFRSRAMVESLLGQRYLGGTVEDGDLHDLRFLNGAGALVALYAKGQAKRDQSGFVLDL